MCNLLTKMDTEYLYSSTFFRREFEGLTLSRRNDCGTERGVLAAHLSMDGRPTRAGRLKLL